jgi:glycerophosphoryl diester phosphodiesterase
MNSRYFTPPRPRFFAHRGSSAVFPENTIPAFEAALSAGIHYLELDVWGSRDGKIVVHHDETLERTCGDPRRISDVYAAEIATLDAGHGFTMDGRISPFRGEGITPPLLQEVLERFPEARVNIEIKQESPHIEEEVLEVVKKTRSEDRVLLASEKDAVLQRMRPICGGIPTGMSAGEVAAFVGWIKKGCSTEYHPPGDALQIPEEYGMVQLVTPETVAAAHAVGLEMHVWTVNQLSDMRRLLGLGVDGIMSDYPELLMKVSAEV